MNFGQAITALKEGQCVTRDGWNGRRMYLYLASPHVGPQPLQTTIVMHTAQDTHVAWLPSQTDVLADDWEYA
jgi:hypothetical protein